MTPRFKALLNILALTLIAAGLLLMFAEFPRWTWMSGWGVIIFGVELGREICLKRGIL